MCSVAPGKLHVWVTTSEVLYQSCRSHVYGSQNSPDVYCGSKAAEDKPLTPKGASGENSIPTITPKPLARICREEADGDGCRLFHPSYWCPFPPNNNKKTYPERLTGPAWRQCQPHITLSSGGSRVPASSQHGCCGLQLPPLLLLFLLSLFLLPDPCSL